MGKPHIMAIVAAAWLAASASAGAVPQAASVPLDLTLPPPPSAPPLVLDFWPGAQPAQGFSLVDERAVATAATRPAPEALRVRFKDSYSFFERHALLRKALQVGMIASGHFVVALDDAEGANLYPFLRTAAIAASSRSGLNAYVSCRQADGDIAVQRADQPQTACLGSSATASAFLVP